MPRQERIPWSTLVERIGTSDVEEIARLVKIRATSVQRQKNRGYVPAGWLVRAEGGPPGLDDEDESGADRSDKTPGSEISFQAGFRFPGMDPTAIVRDGKPENVREFLAWCKDIANMAENAARQRISGADDTERSPPLPMVPEKGNG